MSTAPQPQRSSLSDRLRQRLGLDGSSAIVLNPDETIVFETGRHFVVLIGAFTLPMLSLLFFGGLAAYRAVGGGFLIRDGGISGTIDAISFFLLAISGFLGLLILILWVRGRKTMRVRIILAWIIAGLGLLIFYRYNGGRIFAIDPMRFADQAFDALNLLLVSLALFSFGFVLIAAYDWLNDELIITNQRVVLDNDEVIIPRLIERKVQRTIMLEDVQNVLTTTETYPQHWLGYGTITVTSARINGNIRFPSAKHPQLTRDKIMGQVQALRRARSAQNYESLIADQVYGEKAPKEPPPLTIKQTQAMNWLRRVLPDNPEVNPTSAEITWRAHWLFLLRNLIGPLLLLFVGGLLLAIGASLGLISGPWLPGTFIVLLLAFLGWATWEIEDYRNDKYILSPDKVIDIDKKPFGPEKRRDAGVDAINNVSSRTTYLSNLLGYGDVVLTTAGSGGEFTFRKVPRPTDVVSKVIEYNVRSKRQKENRALNDTLTLLRHYHEAQIRHQELRTKDQP